VEGGGGKWGLNTCAAKSPGNRGNHTNLASLDFFILFYFIGLESDRAGSRTLEKSSRRDRDQVCAKFESSRQFRGSNMNPKKKSRRCRGLGLDLAISRFIYSLGTDEDLIWCYMVACRADRYRSATV
jgi:hypothetical protein